MAPFLLVIVTSIYLWVAILFACQGNAAMAVVYFGYAAANVGLIMVSV